ncbi:PLC-like phosphodiesterase [Kockiozyma suomiensis]|uniref:PLC-like phosphodiesterase n=1 Tax=Kockiozyma suomiensis TaxID=1337062 RepID=UPI00334316E3
MERYSAKHPENSMESLVAAIEADADGIETGMLLTEEMDVHLSADGHVVISHDPHAKRVFGSTTQPIKDRNYIGDLEHLRSVQEPHSKMILLEDVLQQFVSNPKFEGKWICIDVKADNDVAVIEGIAKIMLELTSDFSFWKERVVLGIWLVKFLPLCREHVPLVPLIHIGVDPLYAENFIHEPSVIAVSLLVASLYSNKGYGLIKSLRNLGKLIYAWTVNGAELMNLCIGLDIDAVLTDDPAMFAQLRLDSLSKVEKSNDRLQDAEGLLSFKTKARLYGFCAVVSVLGPLYRRRFE